MYTCKQYSDEWYKARLGIPTSSNFDKIITAKGVPSKQAKNYMYRLAGETIIGQSQETYQSEAMLRGLEMEEEARQLYQIATGNKVEQMGFCVTEGKAVYGCSPDGLIGKDGMIEIKCPLIHTHVGYLLNNQLPIEYLQQTQGQLLVTGRKWCDFVSYYLGMEPLIIRVKRDERFLKLLEIELTIFCEKLMETIKKLKEKN